MYTRVIIDWATAYRMVIKMNLLFSFPDLQCIVFLSRMFVQANALLFLSLYGSPYLYIGGRDDVVSRATRYGLDGRRIEFSGERDFTCHPDRPRIPLSLCFNAYQFFRDGKQAGAWYWKHTFLSWVANEFELYLCLLTVPSYASIRWPLPLHLFVGIRKDYLDLQSLHRKPLAYIEKAQIHTYVWVIFKLTISIRCKTSVPKGQRRHVLKYLVCLQ
jgi:hypothetical protein